MNAQYYIHTKAPLPMDVEFLIQDTISLVRPQWKLVANLDEASAQFAEAVSLNYKTQEVEKVADAEESQGESSSEDELDEDESRLPELEDAQSSSEDIEVCCTRLRWFKSDG